MLIIYGLLIIHKIYSNSILFIFKLRNLYNVFENMNFFHHLIK